MHLVSVISPMYNVERYVPQFLNALLTQTYRHLEIILVDDGSTDSTGHLLDEYQEKDSRLKVIHQKNGGVSAARLTGLKAMTGYYCLQLDADDTFEPNMIERLVERADSEDADLTFCDYDIVYPDRTDIVTRQLDKLDRVHYLKAQLAHGMWSVFWNKLIKCSLFFDNSIFPIMGIQNWDDYAVTNRLAIHANRIAYVQEVLYHYNRTNVNSITYSPSKQSHEDAAKALKVVSEALAESDIYSEVREELAFLQLHQKEYLVFSSYRDFRQWRNLFPEANFMIGRVYSAPDIRILRAVQNNRDAWAKTLLLFKRLKNFISK